MHSIDLLCLKIPTLHTWPEEQSFMYLPIKDVSMFAIVRIALRENFAKRLIKILPTSRENFVKVNAQLTV